MFDEPVRKARYGEAFWCSHHDAWKRSDLNQWEYCEVQCNFLKAFGNWRAKFKAEPELPGCKLLYRCGQANPYLKPHPKPWGLSHFGRHECPDRYAVAARSSPAVQ